MKKLNKIFLIIVILALAGYSYFIEPNQLEVNKYVVQDEQLKGIVNLSQIVRCFDPQPNNAYNDIYYNLASLVEDAIAFRYRISGHRL